MAVATVERDGERPVCMLKLFSILGYVAMAGGLLALLATRSVFSAFPVVIVMQSLAVALMVWARITFGRRSFHLAANPTAGGLVTSGPYRFIRHPIYAAVCLFVLAAAGSHGSWRNTLLGCLVVGGALLRIFAEETLLRVRYPEYRAYAANTWRLLPFIF